MKIVYQNVIKKWKFQNENENSKTKMKIIINISKKLYSIPFRTFKTHL